MIELVTKGGKKIGELADNAMETDKLIIKGTKVDLADVYSSEDLIEQFNKQAKELKDDTSKDQDLARTSG